MSLIIFTYWKLCRIIVKLILHWIQGKMMMKACCASCWCQTSCSSPSPTDPTPGRCEFLSWTGADFPLPREARHWGRCRHQFRNPETDNSIRFTDRTLRFGPYLIGSHLDLTLKVSGIQPRHRQPSTCETCGAKFPILADCVKVLWRSAVLVHKALGSAFPVHAASTVADLDREEVIRLADWLNPWSDVQQLPSWNSWEPP